MRRKMLLVAAACAVLTFTVAAAAWAAGGGNALTVAVYGDSPYGTTPTDPTQTALTPAFIDTVNADPAVSLVVHVGDIHPGQQFCRTSTAWSFTARRCRSSGSSSQSTRT